MFVSFLNVVTRIRKVTAGGFTRYVAGRFM